MCVLEERSANKVNELFFLNETYFTQGSMIMGQCNVTVQLSLNKCLYHQQAKGAFPVVKYALSVVPDLQDRVIFLPE